MNMNRFLLVVFASAILASCDNSTPLERANNLVKELDYNESTEITKLDSVFGYKDVYLDEMKANQLNAELCTHLKEFALKKNKTDKERSEFRSKSNELANSAYEAKKKALKEELIHQFANDKKEFLGMSAVFFYEETIPEYEPYKCTAYFDENVKKLVSVRKEKVFK